MKKPKLSEIEARRKQLDTIYASRAKFPHLLPGPSQMDEDNEYLLDLVKRLGKMIDNLNFMHHSNHYALFEDCDYPKCRRVRALLKELEL